ncbi:unnamed protein product, partial [Prunus brigantina]
WLCGGSRRRRWRVTIMASLWRPTTEVASHALARVRFRIWGSTLRFKLAHSLKI